MRCVYLSALLTGALLATSARAQYYDYPDSYGDPYYDQPGYGGSSLVDSWYRRFLGRAPDPGSQQWVEELQRGRPPQEVLSSILGSDEYYQRAGSTPQGFIYRLFRDVTGRRPTPREATYWVRRVYVDDRGSIAYDLLARHPGAWQAGRAPAFDYDYRRPYYRYGR